MIGQIVVDTMHQYPEGVINDLGGLIYSIMAMDALMRKDDVMYPMTRVGYNALGTVKETLGDVSHISQDGIVEDENPNNRVELRYTDAETRVESVTGGVGAMKRKDLLPVEGFDGLLINLVSGREIEAKVLSSRVNGSQVPVHLDLHSYLIDYDECGKHYWRRPDGWEEWLDLCDTLQVNRDELFTIGGRDGEIFEVGSEVWQQISLYRVSCLLVTDGKRGSWGWYLDEDLKELRCFVPAYPVSDVVDPTGSGDVYGAAFFISRLRGESTERAMILASRAAGFSCARSGTNGLNRYLREEENRNGIVKESDGIGTESGS
jgi:sugar/nucleoside kinase (ribokinase family)